MRHKILITLLVTTAGLMGSGVAAADYDHHEKYGHNDGHQWRQQHHRPHQRGDCGPGRDCRVVVRVGPPVVYVPPPVIVPFAAFVDPLAVLFGDAGYGHHHRHRPYRHNHRDGYRHRQPDGMGQRPHGR